MRESFSTQPSLFATHDVMSHPALAALDGVEATLDWARLEALLPAGEDRARAGRPGYPALTLFRALLLGLWYDLSDVKLAAQLARDLLFRKFCRLELDQGTPDATTLGRFRAQLGERLEPILAEVVAQLEEAKVILTEGRVAIVDATAVEAAQNGRSDRPDPEAGWRVQKGMRAVWGWQAFVNADEDGFIRRVAVSPGNRAEIDSLAELVVGDEAALYADAAYVGPRAWELLARAGISDQVQRRAARGRPLTREAKERNVEIGVTRGRVEAIFGSWKRHWSFRRSRFLGLARNRLQVTLAAVGWNLAKAARFRRLYG